jgi:two-component system nitrogen regulation response regulator NtrX
MAADILIVDDEADICELVAGILQDEGYATAVAHNSDAALGAIAARRPNLVFWTSGCRAASSTDCSCSKRPRSSIPIYRSDDFRARQHRNRRRSHQARRL